jgi:hypothetical protein
MPADMLTKALSKTKFTIMRQYYLALLPLSSEGRVKVAT